MMPYRVLAALGCAILVGACAIVPDGGRITSATIAEKGGQQDPIVQLIPPAPQPGWTASAILNGFLLASASFTDDHAIARKYLTPSAARSWHPGSSVLEFAATPTVTTIAVQQNSVTLQVNGRLLGTISEDGQYQAAEEGVRPHGWRFTVVKVRGQWRIASPPNQLLLSRNDVGRTFRSWDLYFFDRLMSVLVPDPVFVPAEATSADLVTHLVDALRQGPQGWLAVGTRTAFPHGTRVLGTSVDGSTAIVNLGGRVVAANGQQRDQMAEQLLETLASVGPTPSVDSVVFEINGKPVHISCAPGPALQLGPCGGPLPSTAGAHAYYIDRRQRVATLSGPRSDATVPGPAGTGPVPFGRIAVSRDEMSLAGVTGGVLYTGNLTQEGRLTRRLTTTTLTTLSWDSADGLWAAGRKRGRAHVWRLIGGAKPVEVTLPPGLGPVTAMRVAPDGVRVVLITGSRAGSRLWLAAISRSGRRPVIGKPLPIGTDISNMADLTWYDAGDVIVLTRPRSGAALYEVPVDGGQSRQMATAPGTVSITSSGNSLVAACDNGTLMQLPNPYVSIWRPAGARQSVVRGYAPVYPG